MINLRYSEQKHFKDLQMLLWIMTNTKKIYNNSIKNIINEKNFIYSTYNVIILPRVLYWSEGCIVYRYIIHCTSIRFVRVALNFKKINKNIIQEFFKYLISYVIFCKNSTPCYNATYIFDFYFKYYKTKK